MFEGSYVAIVTPFKNGEVDEKALAELIEFQIAEGTNGIVPCGTTGESPTLSHAEHARVVELTVKFVNKRVPVMAGAGSNSTREAIELTRHAKEAGADGALSVIPYYNKPTQGGMIAHFKAIAKAVPGFPLVVYNIPGRTGVAMATATLVDLAKAEKSVVGVKEATGNLDNATEAAAALGASFDVLSGDDSLTLPILSVGGKGIISVVANIIPKDVAALCAAWKKGDRAQALALHQKMYPLVKALFLETNPIPIKAAMAWMGLCGPDVRLPLTPPEKGTMEKLEKALTAYGLRAGQKAPAAR